VLPAEDDSNDNNNTDNTNDTNDNPNDTNDNDNTPPEAEGGKFPGLSRGGTLDATGEHPTSTHAPPATEGGKFPGSSRGGTLTTTTHTAQLHFIEQLMGEGKNFLIVPLDDDDSDDSDKEAEDQWS
jgi:hypothetical protein